MKPETKAFLTKLADMMQEYGVTISVMEESRGYAWYCSGVEFDTVQNQYKDDWYWDSIKFSKSLDADEVLEMLQSDK